jgi:hypothetical protein
VIDKDGLHQDGLWQVTGVERSRWELGPGRDDEHRLRQVQKHRQPRIKTEETMKAATLKASPDMLEALPAKMEPEAEIDRMEFSWVRYWRSDRLAIKYRYHSCFQCFSPSGILLSDASFSDTLAL